MDFSQSSICFLNCNFSIEFCKCISSFFVDSFEFEMFSFQNVFISSFVSMCLKDTVHLYTFFDRKLIEPMHIPMNFIQNSASISVGWFFYDINKTSACISLYYYVDSPTWFRRNIQSPKTVCRSLFSRLNFARLWSTCNRFSHACAKNAAIFVKITLKKKLTHSIYMYGMQLICFICTEHLHPNCLSEWVGAVMRGHAASKTLTNSHFQWN